MVFAPAHKHAFTLTRLTSAVFVASLLCCVLAVGGCSHRLSGNEGVEAKGIAYDIKKQLIAKCKANGGALDPHWTVLDLYNAGDEIPAGNWWKVADFTLYVDGPDTARIVLHADPHDSQLQLIISSVANDEHSFGYTE